MIRTLLFLAVFHAAYPLLAQEPLSPARTLKKPSLTTWQMLDEFRKELASVEAAIQKDGRSVEKLSRRGDLCLFLARYRDSVSAFEGMVVLDRSQEAPHWRLGIAYYLAGDPMASARQFQKYHDYDGRDRENGIWKFLADARANGLQAARKQMLVYTQFDREPFPSLYAMFAGEKTSADVLAEIERKKLTDQPKVVFFAQYYAGLNDELLGNHASAVERVSKAVALFGPETAAPEAGGPGYMWQVARVHLLKLTK